MKDIDELLREDARAAIPDGGFSARVMGALPPARTRARAWLRPSLVLGSAALGSVLAATLSPDAGALFRGFEDIVRWRGLTSAAFSAIALAGALLASALVFAGTERLE